MSDIHNATPTNPTPSDPAAVAPDPAAVVDPNADPAAVDPAADPAKTEPTEFTPLTAEDIVIPEGFEVDEPLRDEFLGLANEAKLPKETVGKLIALQAKANEAASERVSRAWEETQEQWREQAKSDPVIGGDKLDGVLSSVGKVIDAYGKTLTPEAETEFRQVMDMTGAGNHPAVIKFIHSLAKQLDEGGPVLGSVSAPAANAADLIYNNPTSRK